MTGRQVRRGQQAGQAQRQCQHHHRGDGALLQDVVAPVRAPPRRRRGCRDGAAAQPPAALGRCGIGVNRMRDPADPYQQHVPADDGDQHDRQQHDVPHQHLAEIHHVEERAHPDGVERVLAAGGDPLRVEVRLRHIAGEALHDREHEGDHAGDPGHRAAAAPGGHPELAPQVDDDQGHEQLDAPQVQAVEEMTDRVVMPPVRAAEGQGEPGHDRHPEGRQRADAEHVNPGRHVGGLPVGQQLARRQRFERTAPHPRGPHPGGVIISRLQRRSRMAAHVAVDSCGGLLAVSPGEREQQGGPEDDDHHGDQDQVRHRHVEDRPVQESARLIHVDRQSRERLANGARHNATSAGIRPNDATEVRSSLTRNLGYARAHPPRASRSTGYARSIGATRLWRRPPVTESANLGDDGPGGPHPRRFAGTRDARPSF